MAPTRTTLDEAVAAVTAVAAAHAEQVDTVTAEGIYWHPVAALDENALVSRQILPLAPALDRVSKLFTEQWSSVTAATSMFACA